MCFSSGTGSCIAPNRIASLSLMVFSLSQAFRSVRTKQETLSTAASAAQKISLTQLDQLPLLHRSLTPYKRRPFRSRSFSHSRIDHIRIHGSDGLWDHFSG